MTDSLIIRLATEADADATAAIYRPSVVDSATSFELVPPGAEEIGRRIRTTLRTHPWLSATLDDVVVGYAYATPHRTRAAYQWSVETSVYVRDTVRRRGVARALYRSLFRILAAQGYVNAYAGIALPNPASVAAHEAVGFRPLCVYRHVGFKLDRWHDVGWWELELQVPMPSPAPPRPLASVQADPAWSSMLRVERDENRTETAEESHLT